MFPKFFCNANNKSYLFSRLTPLFIALQQQKKELRKKETFLVILLIEL